MSHKSRESFVFRGQAFFIQLPIYANVLLPIVCLKRLLEALYSFLIRLIWAEFVKGEHTADSLMSLVLFLIFCGLSLLTYSFRNYSPLITASFFGLWLLDRIVTQQRLRQSEGSLLGLEDQGGWVLWSKQLPSGKSQLAKFQQAEVAKVVIQRVILQGGIFYSKLGAIWRVEVVLCDSTGYTLNESHQPIQAVQAANQLAAHFQVPLVFTDSEGQGIYAAETLNLQAFDRAKTKFPETIQVQRSAQRWQICAQWRAISFWLLGKQLAQEFGFFIFVLLMSSFMIGFGHGLAVLLFSPSIASETQPLMGELPYFSWQIAIDAALTLGLMLFRAAQISREEHLTIDSTTLSFRLNNCSIAQVPTETIVSTLFLKQPFPTLLIITPDQVIEINELQQEIEFRAMLLAIDEAIGQSRSSSFTQDLQVDDQRRI